MGDQPIAIGDLFESEGRLRTLWVVDAIINMPGAGPIVRLAQIEGAARFTISVSDLRYAEGFRRVREARLAS